MKLCRFHANSRPVLGVECRGFLCAAAAFFDRAGERAPDVVLQADLKSICAAPDSVIVFLRDVLGKAGFNPTPDGATVFDPATVKFLPPIPNPEKFFCVGLNYMDHCTEQKKEPPKSPVFFAKFANAITGHGDPILKTPVTSKLDYEGELGVVIGLGGKGIKEADALRHVFGYTIINDVSARDLQRMDGQFLRGKSQDSYAPVGPYVLVPDDKFDPQNLAIRTEVNGAVVQSSNTCQMVFPVARLISFISEGITLAPGDIISTGTPGGVAEHRNPPTFLQDGDEVAVIVEHLGALRNPVKAA